MGYHCTMEISKSLNPCFHKLYLRKNLKQSYIGSYKIKIFPRRQSKISCFLFNFYKEIHLENWPSCLSYTLQMTRPTESSLKNQTLTNVSQGTFTRDLLNKFQETDRPISMYNETIFGIVLLTKKNRTLTEYHKTTIKNESTSRATNHIFVLKRETSNRLL